MAINRRRFANGMRVVLIRGNTLWNFRQDETGIIRGRERVDAGEGWGYALFNVELPDGRIIGVTSDQMAPLSDPVAATQTAMELA